MAPRPSAATDDPAQVVAPAPGAPDPSTWVLDPEGRARDWLDKPPIDAADLKSRPAAYAEVLSSHGLLLDLDSPMLAIRGGTLHDRSTLGYPIEYLVVTEKGKTYEAAILVRAMPSVIGACLEAMGLTPGSPTRFDAKDPPPTDEEYEAGESPWIMTRSGGPVLSVHVQWTDGDGVPHETSLESLLMQLPVDGGEPQPLTEQGWVFCGSGWASYRQGRDLVRWHRGDAEGDVMAIYLDGRGSCLLERNSLDGVDGSLYTLDPDTAPPADTPITLVLRPTGQSVTAAVVEPPRPPDAVTGDPSAGR